jgi:hypothetical protein
VLGLIIAQIPKIRSHLLAVQQNVDTETLRDLLQTLTVIAWVWANSRLRSGGGPLHIVDAPGAWRGYPFMFESWGWADAGRITVWREFYFIGLFADVCLLLLALVYTIRRFGSAHVMVSLAATLPICIFIWLNVEPWIQGKPLAFQELQSTVSFEQAREIGATWRRGFPFPYQTVFSTETMFLPWITNAALGILLSMIPYGVQRVVTRRDSRKKRS